MIVYHADALNSLKPGMRLELSRNWSCPSEFELLYRRMIRIISRDGLSHFGANHMLKPPSREYADGQMIEIMAEYVRLRHFPDLPSRFTCAFAARSVEAARKWSGIIAGDDVVAPVYALECNTVYIADARLLDYPDTLSYTFSDYPASMLPRLYEYWYHVHMLLEEEVSASCGKSGNGHMNAPDFGFQKEELLVPLPARVLYRVPPSTSSP